MKWSYTLHHATMWSRVMVKRLPHTHKILKYPIEIMPLCLLMSSYMLTSQPKPLQVVRVYRPRPARYAYASRTMISNIFQCSTPESQPVGTAIPGFGIRDDDAGGTWLQVLQEKYCHLMRFESYPWNN